MGFLREGRLKEYIQFFAGGVHLHGLTQLDERRRGFLAQPQLRAYYVNELLEGLHSWKGGVVD